MRFFNKLERRFGRYAIHNLMYYIIIMYVMGFVMMYMDPMFFTRYLSLDAEAILHGQVWRLVTFLLYPPTLSPSGLFLRRSCTIHWAGPWRRCGERSALTCSFYGSHRHHTCRVYCILYLGMGYAP